MTQKEIEKLSSLGKAVKGKEYSDEYSNLYIGLSTGRVKLLPNPEEIKIGELEGMSSKYLKDILEEVADKLLNRSSYTEINFGDSLYTTEKEFDILNSSVKSTDIINVSVRKEFTSDGKREDEPEMDSFYFMSKPYDGGFKLFVRSLQGSVHGKFKINYTIN